MIELESDTRASLITDPPDGRIPALTPAGRLRQTAAAAAAAAQHRAPSPRDLGNALRCITAGVPQLGGRYGSGNLSHYQIYQTPEYVVLEMEVIHDARIIPLDGSPHLPQNVRTWNGDPRGHWEGQTLVVDTTNFSSRSTFMGSAENLHLVERFTRVAADEIRYEVTLDDAATLTQPWSASVRWKQSQDTIYEYACHERNGRMMEDILRAARAADQTAAGPRD